MRASLSCLLLWDDCRYRITVETSFVLLIKAINGGNVGKEQHI